MVVGPDDAEGIAEAGSVRMGDYDDSLIEDETDVTDDGHNAIAGIPIASE